MKTNYIIVIMLLSFTSALGQLFNHTAIGDRVQEANKKSVYEYFLHGVASGDPTQNSVILWTRISNESADAPEISYVLTSDIAMTDVKSEGNIQTSADRDYTVKIDAEGLEPGTTYYYQFTHKGEKSPIGRTRTAAVDDEHLRFAVVSCSNFQAGYFNAYRLISTHQDLDAVIHLGDYIYEYGEGGYGWDSLLMRGHDPKHEILTLIDYRTRYSFYRLDQDLQAVHQQHPFIVVWDDHESANDSYKDGAQNHNEDEGDWEERKAVAKKAWFEWMPVRDKEDQKIYRSLDYGNLMNLTMIDTRLEGRVPQVENVDDPLLSDPSRTLLGEEQLTWFKNELKSNTSNWHIIGNQVIFGQVDLGSLATLDPRAGTLFYDTWGGYPTERDTIIHFIENNDLDNIVILTGDFHITFADDIAVNPFDTLTYNPNTGEGSVCVEMAVPSVTSANFDENVGSLVTIIEPALPKTNPHLKKLELSSHGYAILDVKPNKAQVDYFFTDTLFIPSINEIYAGSLSVQSGDNFWQEAGEVSEAKSESPDLAPNNFTSVNDGFNTIPVNLLGTYPNPADEFSVVNMQLSKAAEVELQLVDIQGKVIQQISNENILPGFYSINISTTSLSDGVYLVRAIVDNSVRTAKLVVQH